MLSSCAAFLALAGASLALPASRNWIEKDVCVIGGGSSGTYAAVRLQQMGLNVALIEKEAKLGGPVTTYVHPSTGQTYDYGVQIFSNISVVHDFFTHFEIPLVQLPPLAGVTTMMNFETGKVVPPAQLYMGNITEALLGFAEQEAKYSSIYKGWDGLPNPVPSDLLLPFGDFLQKHHLDAFAYIAFLYDQGLANLLKQPTLYVMKYQDQVQIRDLMFGSFVVNALQNNQLLYDRAEAELGSSVYVNSHPKKIVRHSNHVEIEVITADGTEYIKAKKLLVTVPPKLTLNFLDADDNEHHLFGQFNSSYYWNALIRHSGIPDGTTLANVNPGAAMNIAAMPGLYTFQAAPVPGLHAAYYSSPHDKSTKDVAKDILTTLARVRQGAGFAEPEKAPEFVRLHKWAPFGATVSNDAIRSGFYEELVALQGKRNTWWTGAAWLNQATSTLWRYTEEEILPRLVEDEARLRLQCE